MEKVENNCFRVSRVVCGRPSLLFQRWSPFGLFPLLQTIIIKEDGQVAGNVSVFSVTQPVFHQHHSTAEWLCLTTKYITFSEIRHICQIRKYRLAFFCFFYVVFHWRLAFRHQLY